MRAIVFDRYGPPDLLHLEDIPKPVPGAGELLVRVHAASINSWDWDLLRGSPFVVRSGGVFRPKKIKVLGCDVAGIVESAGPGLTRFQPGDAVYGDLSASRWGGFGEYVCEPEQLWSKKPDGMTFAEAAALPQAGVLALQGLRLNGEIRPGSRVLFNGAGGGVGTLGLQIAKAHGAHVTCVDVSSKLDALRRLGADEVVDCGDGDAFRSGKQYDLIIDVAASHSLAEYRRALLPGGMVVIVGGLMRTIFLTGFLGGRFTRNAERKVAVLVHKPEPRDVDTLGGLFETGRLAPVIDATYPLEQVPEALRHFGTSDFVGKIVVTHIPD
jgi:NADPH:quinone reductase-like Zn-dependent oxidoreductase